MKKTIIVVIFLLSAISVYSKTNELYHKGKAYYKFNLQKALNFLNDTEKYNWLQKYEYYIEQGFLLPVDLDRVDENIKGTIPTKKYYGNPEFLYNYLTLNGDIVSAPVIGIANEIYIDLENSLRSGNQILSAIYIGVLTKYISSTALWPYYMGLHSLFGKAKDSVVNEFFSELDKLIKSDKIYKLDQYIKFDGFLNKKLEITKSLTANLLLTSKSELGSLDCIMMYNLTPMSNLSMKSVVLNKNVEALSGEYVGYDDWEDKYFQQLGISIGYAINSLTDILYKLPKLDLTPPEDIKGFTVKTDENVLKLFWEPSTDPEIKEQIIYIAESGKKYKKEVSLPRTAGRYIIRNLKNNTLYNIKLTLKDITGKENKGIVRTGTPSDKTPPLPPRNLKIIPGNTKVKLSWNASKSRDVVGYIVYVDDGSSVENYYLEKDKKYLQLDNLKNDIEYKFQVTSIDRFPNESQPLTGSTMPKDKTAPNPVTNIVMSGVNGVVKVNWNLSVSEENDVVKQFLYFYENGKLKEKREFPNNINTYYFRNLKNDNIYRTIISVIDEADNISDSVSQEYKLLSKGRLFFRDKSFTLNNPENITAGLYVYDINGDGLLDLIINQKGKILIGLNSENGYSLKSTDITVARLDQIFICDLNGDIEPEIIINDGGKIKIYKLVSHNYNYRDISNRTAIYQNTKYNYINKIDYNNDNYIDIITVTSSGEIKLFQNNGYYKFQDVSSKVNFGNKIFAKFLMICDLDNDYVNEIVAFNKPKINTGIKVYKLNKNKTAYTDATDKFKNLAVNNIVKSAAYFDYNNDGKLDVIYTLAKPDNQTASYVLLFKNSNGTFERVNNLVIYEPVDYLTFGDIDLDGYTDIYLSGLTKNYLLKNENGIFLDVSEKHNLRFNAEKNRKNIVLFDDDNDGDPDLITVNGYKIKRYINNRNSGSYIKLIFNKMNPLDIKIKKTNTKFINDFEFKTLGTGVYPYFINPPEIYFSSKIFDRYNLKIFNSKNDLIEKEIPATYFEKF